MSLKKKSVIFGLMIFMIHSISYADCDHQTCQGYSQNLWQPRPFSSYKTREMIMLQDQKLRFNLLSFATEFMYSFGDSQKRLGALPFWSGTNTMTIGTNDGKSDLDAYQFGLGDVTHQGSITLTPEVKHVGTEMLWRLAYSPDEHGVYFQFKAPLGAMVINNKICENVARTTFDEDEWPLYPCQQRRFESITQALVNGYDNKTPELTHGRLCNARNTVVRFGDIEAVLGYNAWTSDKGYFGLGLKLSCPTGNVPDARFMLEPVFGRAGHWGIGAELHGSYLVYETNDYMVDVRVRGDILHLTSGRRPNWRSFDLKQNGRGSRYMLLQRYSQDITLDEVLDSVICNHSAAEVIPAIRLTTIPVLSTFSVESSFAVMVDWSWEKWNASMTAEFWGRSHECLKIDEVQALKEQEFELNQYAVLGRQVDEVVDSLVALNLCEPLARINKSENRVLPDQAPRGSSTQLDGNAVTKDTVFYDSTKVKDATKAENRIPAKHKDALDIAGAEALRAFTGKITFEVGRLWPDNKHEPHVSVFGGVEFANQRSKMVSMWSLGVQGSAKF